MGSNQIEVLESRTMMSVVPIHPKPAPAPVTPKQVLPKQVTPKQVAPIKTIDPVVTSSGISYQSFAADPLFASDGPTISDINQGDLGDCYLLSTIGSVVNTDPSLIRKDITADGNGIYTVTFGSGKTAKNINVNSDLPVWSDGQLAYAGLGNQNSIWVALMEKAYVIYASPSTAKYASISGGWMTTAFSALGLSSSSFYSASSGTALLQTLGSDLSKGDFVTFGTQSQLPAGSPLVASHAYEIDSVSFSKTGAPISLTLRNPWGNSVADDGYVTVTAAQAFTAFAGVVISHS